MNTTRLGAFGISRREIAVAIFTGQQLDFWEIRSLPNDAEEAKTSASAFARWVIERLGIDGAAILNGRLGSTRKEHLRTAICTALRERGIPILEANQEQLFAACSNPPVKRPCELREIVCSLFPQLSDQREVLPLLDAAALGLHVETQRLLTSNATVE